MSGAQLHEQMDLATELAASRHGTAPDPPDERRGVPSASGFLRLSLCPGSHALSHGLEERDSEARQAGIVIHAALDLRLRGKATDWPDALAPEEIETAEKCYGLVQRLIDEQGFRDGIFRTEARLWWLAEDGTPQWSGKADLFVVHGTRRALVVDFKTGRGAVEAAHENLQLRALAVLLSYHYEAREVVAAIVQPWTDEPVTVCRYGPEDLTRAAAEMNGLVARATALNAPRVAGAKQCQYCRAKSICTEYAAWATLHLPLPVTLPSPLPPAKTWTPAQWKAFLDWRGAAKQFIEDREEEARRLLEASPESIPGYHLAYGRRRTVTDPIKVYQRAKHYGVSAEAFGEVCKVSLKAVGELLRTATEKSEKPLKGRGLKLAVDGCIEGCVREKMVGPMVEAV